MDALVILSYFGLFYIYVSRVDCSCTSRQAFVERTDFKDIYPDYLRPYSESNVTKMECVGVCHRDWKCASFYYIDTTNTCQLFKELIFSTSYSPSQVPASYFIPGKDA